MTMNENDIEKQLVVVCLQEEEFGIDIQYVREIVPMMPISRLPNAAHHIQGVINLRGRIIPAISLQACLAFEKPASAPDPKRIVLVEVNHTKVGLIVDDVPEILTLRQDEIEPVDDTTKKQVQVNYIQSIAKLKNRLLIILELSEIIAIVEPHLLENAPIRRNG